MKQLAIALIALLGLACNEHTLAYLPPAPCAEEQHEIPLSVNRDIDILFVIDDSASMAEEQASLVANFSRFMEVLRGIGSGLPSVHIAVVSTDMGAGPHGVASCVAGGQDGRFQTGGANCAGPADAFITDIARRDGDRVRNYDGDLSATFGCMADLGIEGCAFEQPLAAMKRALDGTHVKHAGFLRDDAFLLVIIITDEDDCSADPSLFDPADDTLGPLSSFRCFRDGVVCDDGDTSTAGNKSGCRASDSSRTASVAEYADFLRGLKEDPERILVATITGSAEPVVVVDSNNGLTLEPSCSSSFGEATPPTRLTDFLSYFPARATTTSICTDDLSAALDQIAETTNDLVAPCLQGEIDLDPESEGIQFDCVISDVHAAGTDAQQETIIPPCTEDPPAQGSLPCYRLEVDRQRCPSSASGAIFEVERGGASIGDVRTEIRCLGSCSL